MNNNINCISYASSLADFTQKCYNKKSNEKLLLITVEYYPKCDFRNFISTYPTFET